MGIYPHNMHLAKFAIGKFENFPYFIICCRNTLSLILHMSSQGASNNKEVTQISIIYVRRVMP